MRSFCQTTIYTYYYGNYLAQTIISQEFKNKNFITKKMQSIEPLIASAIENGTEMRERVTTKIRKYHNFCSLSSEKENGTHLQISFPVKMYFSRINIIDSLKLHEEKYGIVKHSIQKKNKKTHTVTLILKKNATIMNILKEIYVAQAIKIMEHITTLIQKSDGCSSFTVIFSEIESLERVSVSHYVLFWLHKAFSLTRILHLLQRDAFFLRFSIF